MAKECDSVTGERSLYDCFHARVKGRRVYCVKGYRFNAQGARDGSIGIKQLARGEPLIMGVCQECADFESMGEPIPAEERGWLKQATERAPQIQERKTFSKITERELYQHLCQQIESF